MRNFSIMALEERIVLDATLVNAADFVTKTIYVGEAVDLSGGIHQITTPGAPISAPSWFLQGFLTDGLGAVLKTGGSSGDFSSTGIALVSLGLPPTRLFIFSADTQAVTYNAPGVYNVYLDFVGNTDANLQVGVITVVAPPLHVVSEANVNAIEGQQFDNLELFSFVSSRPDAIGSDFSFTISHLSAQPNFASIGDYSISKDLSGVFHFTIDIQMGNSLAPNLIEVNLSDFLTGEGILAHSVINVANAPLTSINLGALPPVVEGQLFNDVLVAQFTDANPNTLASDFTAFVGILSSGSPVALQTDIQIIKGSDGVFSVFADLKIPNNVGNYQLDTTIIDVPDNNAATGMNSRPLTASDALLSVGSPLDIAASQGVLFSGKIGSFIDNNPNELASNYNGSTINWGDGSSSAATLVSLGNGAYDVYGSHTFASNPNGLVGTFIIKDGLVEGTENGSFNIHSVVQQLLWGVDENTGMLFSVSDYSQAGAANRVTVYGQLHTAAGIIGSGIDAFTIDAADANGKNAAYFAVSKAVAGINTFSIGVIADINDLAHNTEVKLYTISGMSFNMAKDAITGLAVDPITGNLMGVVVRGDSASSSLFVIDKNSLQSSNQVAKAYNLGAMVGSDDSSTQLGQAVNQLLGLFGINDLIGGMKITNARDMAFDNAGRLFVTDGAKDILYQINVGNGEIIGIANAKEQNGLSSNPNIEALAWDPIAGKLVGASSVANLSDLIGLSVTGGANTLDVDNLMNLQDVQGMAFKPQFAFHGGADLGILIDFANTDLEYRAGDRAVLLLQNVDLIDYGGNSYNGGSLNVDVSDNANSLTDQLAVSNGGDIKVVGSEVRYKNILIGMIDGLENGKNGKDLTFHFNANASEKAVEALMNRISYMNTASSLVLGNKSVAFTITDSLGAVIGYTTVDLEIEKKYF